MNIINKKYKGINGVYHISSGIPGPNILVSCLTHGSEVSGLNAIMYLTNKYAIKSKLLKGSINFIIVNIQAYNHYQKTLDYKGSRFVDENMNRCATEYNIRKGNSYEAQRLRDIYPILACADYHIDIHSTTQSPKSVAIYTNKSKNKFIDILDVDEHYIDLTQYQCGKPLIDVCERNGGYGLGIETGIEGDNAIEVAIDNILLILYNLGLIENNNNEFRKKFNIHYSIIGSILVNDDKNFKLTKKYNHGDFVKENEIIAYENNKPVSVKKNSIIILPSKFLYKSEEYCFLARADNI